MKKFLFLVCSILLAYPLFASHIVGGEVTYKYLGPGSSGTSIYQVSLRLFRDCNVPCGGNTNVACLPATALVSIFDNVSPYNSEGALSLPLSKTESITLTTYPQCISTKPSVCYEVKTYTNTVTLKDNVAGYIIAYQNCCRAVSENVLSNANTISNVPGATYTCTIPGTGILPTGHNNSAVFGLKDTTLVCYQSSFVIDFSATDADGDSLSYAFAPAYGSNDFTSSQDLVPAGPPPYNNVTYKTTSNFNGVQPLGPDVSINQKTGIISGIAPAVTGRYVVNVIVYEWRNGVLIANHRKDFIMRVENCNIPKAVLKPSYITCDGFNLTFQNESTSPLINSYYWDFGEPGVLNDTSTSPAPDHYFADSGTYTITLITNKGQQCSDTATATAKVYPGFVPDFTADGSCNLVPYSFTDKTTSKYGRVDSWHWDFGVPSLQSDTSLLQNPSYLYPAPQTAMVQLIVTNSKGCVDTTSKTIIVTDKPQIITPFTDTLICVGDTLQLHVSSTATSASFEWSPSTNISDTTTTDPFVYPNNTTAYEVTLRDKGCTAKDTITVNVIDHVTLNAGSDTLICLTDSIMLNVNTDALYFSWSPAATLNDSTLRNPIAVPLANTLYTVTGRVGHCSATGNILVSVSPYPQVAALGDTSICYGDTAFITATTNAPNFYWSSTDSSSLIRSTTLTPEASPKTTTTYIITATNNSGCRKPAYDSVLITVIPPVQAFAGRDTIIVTNQPLQLNATGGTNYTWSPPTGLSNPNIANPVAILNIANDSIVYKVHVSTPEGCSADDNIKVTVFKTLPEIFIPSAFTPNGDNLNDVARPIVAGMKQFNYFRVFNRAGQLLYSTSKPNEGWDGRFNGVLQPPAAYVYECQAVDYTGNVITKKGTIVLIR